MVRGRLYCLMLRLLFISEFVRPIKMLSMERIMWWKEVQVPLLQKMSPVLKLQMSRRNMHIATITREKTLWQWLIGKGIKDPKRILFQTPKDQQKKGYLFLLSERILMEMIKWIQILLIPNLTSTSNAIWFPFCLQNMMWCLRLRNQKTISI